MIINYKNAIKVNIMDIKVFRMVKTLKISIFLYEEDLFGQKIFFEILLMDLFYLKKY